ncbi:MAG: ATP-dependent 6-phosphofructokinase [Planctomycetota bacterium]|nr:ATP-dependent 6-phosphofructokinase [Planctomycetota bacterium]
MTPPRTFAILTAGGDCPGLNAVVRAVTKGAVRAGINVLGIEDGFLGLIENRTRPLSYDDVSNILTSGGTILGTSNKSNPTRFATGTNADGTPRIENVSDRAVATLRAHDIRDIVVIGGDGSMTVAHQFAACARDMGLELNFIGVPKTIDNDLFGTDITFGFQTAVATATDALDKVHSTAASHHRAIFVEVMGRNAGWIALHAGAASGSDVILLPEIPFSLDSVYGAIRERSRRGRRYSVICVSEGACPVGGSKIVAHTDPTSPDPIRLGGIARWLAERTEAATGVESRYVILGHTQRGGSPIAADRVLGTQFGNHALHLLMNGARNRMAALQSNTLTDVALDFAAGRQRLVSPGDALIRAVRDVGVSFGDA